MGIISASEWLDQHKEQMAADLAAIVKIRSVSDKTSDIKPFGEGCRAVFEEMKSLINAHGLKYRDYDGYVLMTHGDEDPSKPTVGLWGHLDVVPEGSGWRTDPFGAVIENGCLIGRGSQDNKSPAIIALYAMKYIKDSGMDTTYNLRAYFGANEEAGMEDIKYFLEQDTPPDLSIVPDSKFPVCRGEKGTLTLWLKSRCPFAQIKELKGGIASNVVPDWASASVESNGELRELTATGLTKHTARPQGGINAVHELLASINSQSLLNENDSRIAEFFERITATFDGEALGIRCQDELSGALTCVGSMVSLENGIPSLHLNIRYPITVSPEGLLSIISSVCSENEFDVINIKDSAPAFFKGDPAIVNLLTQAYGDVTGEILKPFTMEGGTYARKLPNALGFGMNFPDASIDPAKRLNSAHEPNEAVRLSDMYKAFEIYANAIIRLNDYFNRDSGNEA